MSPRSKPDPWQQAVIDRYIHDPRTFWCDMPRGQGIEAFRDNIRTGHTTQNQETT